MAIETRPPSPDSRTDGALWSAPAATPAPPGSPPESPTRSSDLSTPALGALLVAAGVLFLIGQVTGISVGPYGWPFLVVGAGLVLFASMALGGPAWGGVAIPASVVTTVGLVLLYQNTFNRWESWSYAWALIPTAVGIGQWIQGTRNDEPGLREAGRRTMLVGGMLFLVFAAFFEGVLNISHLGTGDVARYALPVALIVIGALVLMRRGGQARA